MKLTGTARTLAAAALACCAVAIAEGQDRKAVTYELKQAERNLQAGFSPSQLGLWDVEGDLPTVMSAADRVMGIFRKQGLGENDAARGLAWSYYWSLVQFSSSPTPGTISVEVLETKAKQLGKIVITSKPEAATVFIDSRPIDSRTTTEVFAVEGERWVEVWLEDRKAIASCAVKPNLILRFVADFESSTPAVCVAVR